MGSTIELLRKKLFKYSFYQASFFFEYLIFEYLEFSLKQVGGVGFPQKINHDYNRFMLNNPMFKRYV